MSTNRLEGRGVKHCRNALQKRQGTSSKVSSRQQQSEQQQQGEGSPHSLAASRVRYGQPGEDAHQSNHGAQGSKGPQPPQSLELVAESQIDPLAPPQPRPWQGSNQRQDGNGEDSDSG